MLRIALKRKKSKLEKDNINMVLRTALKSKLEKDNINMVLRTALKSKLEKDNINAMLRATLIKYDASHRINDTSPYDKWVSSPSN